MFGSGDLTKSNTCRGSEIIGPLNGLRFISAVTPEVNSTGEVSPIPRAVPRMTAVTSPEREVGSTTPDRPPPRRAEAYDASRRLFGTRRRTTSEARMMIGSIMTLIASAAANPDR
jgi:hypothetical protein